jgi:hypothetical protein
MLMLLTSSGVFAQNKNASGIQSQSSYTNACGDYPLTGTSLHGSSVLTAAKECNTTITESKSTVYFTAHDQVVLYPGFKALNGSKFIARIEANSTEAVTIAEVKQNLIQNVTVSPNPFAGKFITMINSGQAGKVHVTIYNSSGSKIVEQAGVNVVRGINEFSFNLSNYAAGVYMLEINFGDSKIVKKVIKGD